METTSTLHSERISGAERDARAVRIIESIGNTPLVEVTSLSREVSPVRIMGKAEWFNPGGSVKDRPALNMVLAGERSGALTKEKTLLDATSGNTGIAYAMLGSALGYRVKLCVPKNIGHMRARILLGYGAELIFTDPTLGSDGAITGAIKEYESNPDAYFYPDQYANDANWEAHFHTTGVELLAQTKGEITHFVAGLGTTGTFTGTGRCLKEENESIKLVSFQPDSPMHGIEGMKHMPTSIVPSIYDRDLADEEKNIKTEDAQAMVLRMAREEGLLLGLSSGASLVCALQLARTLSRGLVVAMLPDNGLKYLDFNFWDTPPDGD